MNTATTTIPATHDPRPHHVRAIARLLAAPAAFLILAWLAVAVSSCSTSTQPPEPSSTPAAASLLATSPPPDTDPGDSSGDSTDGGANPPSGWASPAGLTHVCTRWPAKCVAGPPELTGLALGLVCCGDGWCLAIATNADCGPSGDVYYCANGQTTTNSQGLPDVECFD